jgi:ATP-dependent RNA helicase DeaD
LSESLLKAILDLGFENPTEVEKAIPIIGKRHRYGCVGSDRQENGSIWFSSYPKIDANNRNTQALILSPTRELCLQITNEIKTTLKIRKGINGSSGGASITDQARDIKRGAQIIVATPGRMQDMINRGLVNILKLTIVF